MLTDPLDPLERARARHERLIATLALGAVVIGIATVLWRIATVDAFGGIPILAVAALSAIVFVVRFVDPKPTVFWKPWTRTTFEVTVCSVVIGFDAMVGPEFLVTSSTGYLHVLAVAICSLRLLPALSLYCAGLAATQQAAVYLWSLPSLPPGSIPVERHYQELVFRVFVLGLVGAVGMVLARTLAREISAAANEERVRNAFGSYVDSRIVRRVLRGDLSLAAQRRPITVMFVDIRGFTAMSETTDPILLFRRLNTALDAFALEVQAQGGIVNKYLGDGLMALFGAPEPQEDHARRAVRAGLRIAESARRMASDGRFPGLQVGVGIHTGETVVGELGGSRREFTAIGDVVNVASRVESLNKEHHTTVLITEEARALIGAGAELRVLPPAEVRGRVGKVTVYEVVGLQGTMPSIRVEPPIGSSGVA